MKRGVVPLILLAVGACASDDILVIADLPENAYVAAVAYRADGSFVGATGLSRRGSDGPIRAMLATSEGIDRVVVYAYDVAAIEALSDRPSDDRLALLEVHVAGPNESVLPTPAWVGAASRSLDVFELQPIDDAPALSADWLPPCPTLLDPGAVGVVEEACRAASCGTKARQSNCELLLEVPLCTGGRLRGTIDGRGTITFDESPQYGSCVSRTPRFDARASFVCTGGAFEGEVCAIDVYEEPKPRAMEVLAVPTGSGAPIADATDLGPRYTGGLAVLDDRVAVARFSTPATPSCRGIGTTLSFYDHTTLDLVATATAPDCLRQLRRIPGTTDFIGLFNDEAIHVARFDRTGRMVASSTIAPRAMDVAIDVAVDAPGDRVAVLLSTDNRGYVRFFDLRTVAPLPDHPGSFGTFPRSITALADGRIAVTESDQDEVYLSSNDDVLKLTVRPGCGRASIRTVRYHAARDVLLIASRDAAQGLLVVDPKGARQCDRLKNFEQIVEPLAMVSSPSDAALVWVALDGAERSGHDRTFLARAHLDERRFLPGATEIGVGPVAELEVSSEGVLFALLAWSDRLVRAVAR